MMELTIEPIDSWRWVHTSSSSLTLRSDDADSANDFLPAVSPCLLYAYLRTMVANMSHADASAYLLVGRGRCVAVGC
jgi:hypothetical protein